LNFFRNIAPQECFYIILGIKKKNKKKFVNETNKTMFIHGKIKKHREFFVRRYD